MSLDFGRKESVPSALRRIVRKRIHSTLELIGREPDLDASERIHEARKQLKQLRALLRLIEPEVGHKRRTKADRRLREVAQSLAPFRDATVLLATLQGLPQGRCGSASFRRLHSILDARCRHARTLILATPKRRKILAKALRNAQRRITRWSFMHRGWKAISPGLKRSYKAGRRASTAASINNSDEALHKSRRRAKDLFYILESLRQVQPAAMRSRIRTMHQLTDLLGNDHDLAVLQAALSNELHDQLRPTELQHLTATVTKQRHRLQRQAREIARTAYTEDADTFIKQMHRHWRSWR